MTVKRLAVVLLAWSLMAGVCSAQSTSVELMAGPDTLAGGISFRNTIAGGFMKIGLSGVYTDDDETQYQMGNLRFVVGNDTLTPGLSVEAGFQAIFGSAEEDDQSGDIGAAAFTARAGYFFPRRLIPVPLEIFGGLTYAPDPLTLMDLEEYVEVYAGVGVQIIPNAVVQLTYHNYDMELNDGHGDFSVDDSVIRVGLVMQF